MNRHYLVSLSLILIFLHLIPCNSQNKKIKKSTPTIAQEHPSLILTKKGVKEIKIQLGAIPVFDEALANAKVEVDAEILAGIQVPIPKDLAGGYTHEQHKKNYIILQKAGVLYQLLDDDKYAKYVRDVLMEYAKMYPSLPIHPQQRSYAPGKLFWQSLNDANWLVYTSQAYDCVYDYLSKKERNQLEKNLFKPFADFLSIGSPQFFNRVHNHSTWGNVAVGMIGLVMNDQELIDRALYGLKDDNLAVGTKDNDGGFIKVAGQKSGFYANLEEPFSPDGYYTEGPYYQRYAMYPFMIFAQALNNIKPDLKIFEYKNGVLIKAVDALLNLTDENGLFFPLNDAQKGMSYYSKSLVSAVDIAYYYGGKNPALLTIAKLQNDVQLDQTGLAVAIGLRDQKEQPFIKKSIEFTDGPNGDQGGIGILRSNVSDNNLSLVFKYAAQGLSHGHYDKLSFSFYNNSNEIIQDYGLARFVNIEQKNGGGYLKENTTWAKQTIAHNTIVQNETSHFKGNYEIASENHSEKYLFDVSNSNIQIASAKELNAYPNTEIHRTMALIKNENFESPIVLDLVRVTSKTENKYDLPYYYLGQIISSSIENKTPEMLSTLGKSYGYQHLWKEGAGISKGENFKLTWLLNNQFYSITAVTSEGDELIFASIGANDPQHNLRKDPAIIIRKNDVKEALFASVIETHGSYSPVSESAINSYSSIENVKIAYDNDNYTAVVITDKNRNKNMLILANNDASSHIKHQIKIEDKVFEWTGPYLFKQIN